MLSLIYFVLILGVIVLVHEFGHFIFAKKFNVYVYEFSIGMGPKIWSWTSKNKETIYSIRCIPIGGYVRLAGEEVDDDKEIPKNRKLYAKPIWQRFLVMVFGALNNFILAVTLLFFISLIYGSPDMRPIIPDVIEDSPFVEAGLKKGDRVVSVNGYKVSSIDDIQLFLSISKENASIVTLENEKKVTHVVTPLTEEEASDKGYSYGIIFNTEYKHGIGNAFNYAFMKTKALIKQMVYVLKFLFTGGLGLKSLSGPVGIYSVVDQASSVSFASVLSLVALLSLNVGFINLIPFPAFDGGRILFLIIEKIKGSPVNSKVENIIHSIGFFLLIALMIYITLNDLLRLF